MGQRFLEWLPAILVICCVPVFGQDCGNTTFSNSTTGTINLVDPVKGKNCTYYIVAGNYTPQVAVIFPAASLDPSVFNLTVYAGNETTSPVISNLTQALLGQPFVVVISRYNVTKIVFSRADRDAPALPSLAVTYNTTGCITPAQNIGGIFQSPYYLPNNGTVNCTYTGTVQAQRLGVLSFTKMNVTSGKVDVKFGANNPTPVTTGTTVPADLFGAVDATVTLNFTFDSKTDVQSFQAIFQSVSPDCSGVKTASTGLTKLTIPQSNQLPVTCYARIEAPDNSQVFITDGGIYTQAKGVDSIVYFDGNNTNSNVIGSVSDGFSWHVSSGKYLTIIASLRAQGSRTTDIQYKSDASSRYYQVTNKTVVVVDGATANGSQVSLTFASQNSSLGNLKFELNSTSVLNDAVIKVLCEGAMTMFTFTKDTAQIPVVMPSSVAFVIIDKLNGSATVSLTVTAIQKSDCDQILASPSGDVLLVAANTTQKTCNILVTAASDVILDLSQVNLCKTGKLEIYQGFNKSSPLLATLSAGTLYPNMAPIKFPAEAGPRLVWTDENYKCVSPTVVGRYWTQTNDSICGALGSSLSGMVQTPNYPNQYPLNILCNWTIPSANNSMLYLMVNKQDFQPGQNFTVQNTTKTVASVNGTADAALPGDFILPNTNLSLLFQSGSQGQTLDLTRSGQGAQLTYKIITCGGVVDKVGNLSIPDAKNRTVECIWILQVPATGANSSVNIVNASFSVSGYQSTSNGSLNIYDGNSMRDSPLLVNMTNKMSTTNLLSRSNSLLVRFTYMYNTSGGPFNLSVSFDAFNCNKSSQCDNGTCMHPDWFCDGRPQCKDGTDERNCNGSQPVPPVTTPLPPSPHKGDETKGVAGYWVFVCLVIGIIVGIILTFAVPKCIGKIRRRNMARSSNYGSLHEDT